MPRILTSNVSAAVAVILVLDLHHTMWLPALSKHWGQNEEPLWHKGGVGGWGGAEHAVFYHMLLLSIYSRVGHTQTYTVWGWVWSQTRIKGSGFLFCHRVFISAHVHTANKVDFLKWLKPGTSVFLYVRLFVMILCLSERFIYISKLLYIFPSPQRICCSSLLSVPTAPHPTPSDWHIHRQY